MRILISTAILAAQGLYRLLRLAPVRRKVVFLSRQADRPSRDFRMLSDEIRRADPTVEVVVRCRFIPSGIGGRLLYAGEVLAQMWHLATASVCVVDGYIVPVSVLDHRRELTVIQMWHALGAVKRFGLQSVGRAGGRPAGVARAMRMHENYDFVLCGGPGSIPAFAEAFGVPEASVLPLGLPRADFLRERAAAAGDAGRDVESTAIAGLRRRFPRLDDDSKTRVLYAPTYRRGRDSVFDDVVAAFAGERFTLIVKPHDLERTAAAGEHVVDASGVDALELLVVADAVVTDYSAIAFEACVVDKPLFFYVHDIEEYRTAVGLNIDPLRELGSVTSTDIRRIAELVARGGEPAEEVRAFASRYLSLPEGGCTAAIAALVVARVGAGGDR